jgi:hypothetical protein
MEVTMRNRGMALIVVFPAVLGLVACGGKKDDDGVASAGGSAKASASPSATANVRDAQLKFAQCMRENGVNVPDPAPGGKGGVRLQDTGADPAKVQAATKKCQPLLQAGGQIGTPNDPKAQDQLLKFARCMRAHGVKMKDPKPGSGGMLQGGQGGSPEKLQAAQKACQSLLPGGGPK